MFLEDNLEYPILSNFVGSTFLESYLKTSEDRVTRMVKGFEVVTVL